MAVKYYNVWRQWSIKVFWSSECVAIFRNLFMDGPCGIVVVA